MEKGGLSPSNLISRLFGFVEQRYGDVRGLHSQAAEIAQGGIESGTDLRGKSVEEHLARKTQAKLSWVSPKSGRICKVRFPADANEDRTGQNSEVAHISGQWASAIEQRRKRDDSFARNAAPGWFQSSDAAECGGDANGASRVCPDAAEAEAGSDGRGGPAARASGNARQIPGIADRTVVGIVGRHAVGEFVHVGFAKKDSACVFELRDDRGVFFRNEVAQDFRTCRCSNILRDFIPKEDAAVVAQLK